MPHVVGPETTLEEIEGVQWGDPPFDSYVVRRSHELRRKPIRHLTAEDLRLLIQQGIGIPVLVPVALELLERDPLADGDHYPGDLLVSVLRSWPIPLPVTRPLGGPIAEKVKDNFAVDVDFSGVRENKSWVFGDDCAIGHSISIGVGCFLMEPSRRA